MNTKLATSRMRTGQWADIIKDCKKSGLKVDDYCAQNGLSRNAYFYWLRKVKEAALTQSGFVEVQQQVEVSSCYPSPKLTASVNEVVLGIAEKHADGFTGKCYKGLEKCLTMLPDSNTSTSVPDTQTLDVVLTALSQ